MHSIASADASTMHCAKLVPIEREQEYEPGRNRETCSPEQEWHLRRRARPSHDQMELQKCNKKIKKISSKEKIRSEEKKRAKKADRLPATTPANNKIDLQRV